MLEDQIKALREYVRAEIVAMNAAEMKDLPDEDTSWEDNKDAEANEKAASLLVLLGL